MIGTMLYDMFSSPPKFGMVISKREYTSFCKEFWLVEWNDGTVNYMTLGGMGQYIKDYRELKKNLTVK